MRARTISSMSRIVSNIKVDENTDPELLRATDKVLAFYEAEIKKMDRECLKSIAMIDSILKDRG
jgi:hypothetical protein